MTSPCLCRTYCGDVPEEDDPDGECKVLPREPEPPLVELILVPRRPSPVDQPPDS